MLSEKAFTPNVVTGYKNHFDRATLSDITICFGDRRIHAHRIVLAVQSPYFRARFAGLKCQESQGPQDVWMLDQNADAVEGLMRYAYGLDPFGALNEPQLSFDMYLAVAAKRFGFDSLSVDLLERMKEHIFAKAQSGDFAALAKILTEVHDGVIPDLEGQLHSRVFCLYLTIIIMEPSDRIEHFKSCLQPSAAGFFDGAVLCRNLLVSETHRSQELERLATEKTLAHSQITANLEAELRKSETQEAEIQILQDTVARKNESIKLAWDAEERGCKGVQEAQERHDEDTLLLAAMNEVLAGSKSMARENARLRSRLDDAEFYGSTLEMKYRLLKPLHVVLEREMLARPKAETKAMKQNTTHNQKADTSTVEELDKLLPKMPVKTRTVETETGKRPDRLFIALQAESKLLKPETADKPGGTTPLINAQDRALAATSAKDQLLKPRTGNKTGGTAPLMWSTAAPDMTLAAAIAELSLVGFTTKQMSAAVYTHDASLKRAEELGRSETEQKEFAELEQIEREERTREYKAMVEIDKEYRKSTMERQWLYDFQAA